MTNNILFLEDYWGMRKSRSDPFRQRHSARTGDYGFALLGKNPGQFYTQDWEEEPSGALIPASGGIHHYPAGSDFYAKFGPKDSGVVMHIEKMNTDDSTPGTLDIPNYGRISKEGRMIIKDSRITRKNIGSPSFELLRPHFGVDRVHPSAHDHSATVRWFGVMPDSDVGADDDDVQNQIIGTLRNFGVKVLHYHPLTSDGHPYTRIRMFQPFVNQYNRGKVRRLDRYGSFRLPSVPITSARGII